jgi:hypothetical protein
MSENTAAETIGDRIVRLAAARPELPKEKKLLAACFGVEYETLRKWSANTSAPNRNRAQVISRVLGVPVDVIMHGAPMAGLPAEDPRGALGRALAVVGMAIQAMPTDRRQELGDLLRQWAQYGGKELYRDLALELLDNGQNAGPLGEVLRAPTAEAMRVAQIMDRIKDPSIRSRLYATAQAMEQEDQP